MPVSLCDCYCQRLKKSRDLHWPSSHVGCAPSLILYMLSFALLPFRFGLLLQNLSRPCLCQTTGIYKSKGSMFGSAAFHVTPGESASAETCRFDLSCQRPEAAPCLVGCATQLGAVSPREEPARFYKAPRAFK